MRDAVDIEGIILIAPSEIFIGLRIAENERCGWHSRHSFDGCLWVQFFYMVEKTSPNTKEEKAYKMMAFLNLDTSSYADLLQNSAIISRNPIMYLEFDL
jgi:hypothetical protein